MPPEDDVVLESGPESEDPNFGLPPLTDKERQDWDEPKGPEKPAFAFEHDGKKFGSPEELSTFIKGLTPGKAAGPTDDIEARISRTLAQERAAWERGLDERLSRFGQPPKHDGKPAAAAKENPFDRDSEPDQWTKWEIRNEVGGVRSEYEEKLKAMEDRYEGLSSAEAEREGKQVFEGIRDRVAKEQGFDPDLAPFVSDLTLADVDGRTDPRNHASIEAEMIRLHTALKSVIDRKVESGIQTAHKKDARIPPTVLKGAGAPVTRMTPSKPEVVPTLTGKHSSANYLRRIAAMRGGSE